MSGGKDSTGENFLSRWSRRKLEVANSESDQEQEPEQLPEALSAVKEDTPPLTAADMPPLESLTEDSDYSGFMSPGVSEELRQLALRKLFRSAAFNVVDGLDDYDEDFTTFEKLGDIVTADMRFQMEQEARRKMEEMLVDDASQVEADEELSAVSENKNESEAEAEIKSEPLAGNGMESGQPITEVNKRQTT